MARVITITTVVVVAAMATLTSSLNVKLSGINYNPRKGADWEPLELKCKSASEVATDMKILATVTSNIRLYSMVDCNQMELVVPAAKAAGLTVWAGIWVDKNAATYAAERDAFAALIKKGVIDATVIGLHVGSEAIYRKEVTADEAIKNFKEVKALVTAAGLKFPVTIADIGDVYVANPQLFAAVDIVSANAFPFWEAKPIEGCIEYFYSRMEPLIKLATDNGKKIMIGETGWATQGKADGASTWFNDFHVLATDLKWSYYYYTSFDTTWRHNPAVNTSDPEVENFFGIFDVKGVLKPAFAALKVAKRVNIDVSPTTTTPAASEKNGKPVATTASPSTIISTGGATSKPNTNTATATSAAPLVTTAIMSAVVMVLMIAASM
ncbi:hypothetical protein DYB25_005647 [Aphanomyces astaci]|uniref:glucan endo-1,3-beta-D-glucosidase n=1 Tax=Aphanomyces astaci TaxID=112090 RepID=A0A397FAG8_APHAT|nr:hypothetical protein DYB36_001356 [Aphanomyces astaci]RHY12448.1 hypothetical protein DYB25_005647 [Aphanomyces astaci]RHY47034.1 hypothetical protein DYB30_003799 [Aphanomyces astaci]RHY49794.1 hypothetical protein DYB38_009593 [Aphanomyces astaci]RHY54878.1 hypothetical protein DYB34_002235 [Aphanomyces astaci]